MNTFEGIDNNKLVFWALQFHGRIFFKALWVDIVWVWQPSDKVIWYGGLSGAFLAYHGKLRVILMEPQNTSWIKMEEYMSTRWIM